MVIMGFYVTILKEGPTIMSFQRVWNFALLCFFVVFTAACQSMPSKQFTKLKTGMDKDDVLQIMGSPDRTQRWQGMDRWTYKVWESDTSELKEVHFSEGIAVYVGEFVKPEISADEQDKINEESNQKLEEQLAARKIENQKQYQKYEQEVRGSESVRRVPRFVPVQ